MTCLKTLQDPQLVSVNSSHFGKCIVVLVYFFLLQIINCATPRDINEVIMRGIPIPHLPSFPTVAGKEHEGSVVYQKVSALT